MMQICYFCCDKAQKTAGFDLQQTLCSLDNALSLRCHGHCECLMNAGIFRWEFCLSSNGRKSEAKVQPDSTWKMNSECGATNQK